MAFVTEHKETILSIIEGWHGKFSDELLGKKLQLELGLKKAPSRHTLAKHDDIKLAIDLKRKELKDKKSQAKKDAEQLFDSGDKLSNLLCNLDNEDTTISELIKRAESLEKENEKLSSKNTRLEAQNNILLERFARWQHNLQKMDGVDLNKLASTIDEGLPAKNRR